MNALPKWAPLVSPFDPVLERLASLELAVGRLQQMIRDIPVPPKPPKPRDVDLTPVLKRLDDLEQAVAGLPAPQATDLDPVLARLARLEKSIAAAPPSRPTYDFQIERDADGKMTKVIARPQSTARTILKG